MAYSDKVLDHYNNPKNIGTLDKSKLNVGTGLVGAPECFSGDTLIAIPEYPGYISLKEAFIRNTPFYVWSFNIKENKFEIKKSICLYNGVKKTINLKTDDDCNIQVTPTHKFLTLEKAYTECSSLLNVSLKQFSFLDFKESCINYNHKIVEIVDSQREMDVYNLSVEENNNYVVLTNLTLNRHSGIVVKNCGDVMRLQIEVDDATGTIVDAKFKTFGCGSAIASSSLATEWLKGRSLTEASKIDNMDIVEELNLPPVKIHCSVLAEDAIKAAINDYRKKNGLEELKFEDRIVH